MRDTPVEDQPEIDKSYFLVKGYFTEDAYLESGWSVVCGDHWTYIPGRGFAVVATPFGSHMVSDFDMYPIEIEDELNRINDDYDRRALQEQLAEIARREQDSLNAEPIAANLKSDQDAPETGETRVVPGRSVILGPVSERDSHLSENDSIQERESSHKTLVESDANYIPQAIGAAIVGAGVFAAGMISFRKYD